jgi:hypothetical protein
MQVRHAAATIILTLCGIVILRDGLVSYATAGLSTINAGESVLGFGMLCGALFLCLSTSGELNPVFRIAMTAVIGLWFLLLGGYGYLKNPGVLESFFILAGIVVLALAGREGYRAIRPPLV